MPPLVLKLLGTNLNFKLNVRPTLSAQVVVNRTRFNHEEPEWAPRSGLPATRPQGPKSQAGVPPAPCLARAAVAHWPAGGGRGRCEPGADPRPDSG